jgi:PPK2 family polyphosphate:nucleotide phosphotransferase
MKIKTGEYRIDVGGKVDLKRRPTRAAPYYKSKDRYREMLAGQIREMRSLQELLYAVDRHSLLLIFQGMDASGKDGAIKHVLSGINPQGCQVTSFKHPGPEDLEHDLLWRTTRSLSERGRFGIFNRSYYEEVLIVRVHPEIFRKQRIPGYADGEKDVWKQRFESIVDHERHLHRNGTRILKFFLHLSKEEQRRRFLKRIEDPEKNWKFTAADIEERRYWKRYMKAYEACLAATTTAYAPWYAIPADDKENARLIISQVILESLRGLKMAFPKADAARLRELKTLRKRLAK